MKDLETVMQEMGMPAVLGELHRPHPKIKKAGRLEPGWYFARMKTWRWESGFVPVKVTHGSPLQVWQCGDQRSWPEDAWVFGRRIYPDVENCNP